MFNRGKTNGHDGQKKTTPHRLKKRGEQKTTRKARKKGPYAKK